MQTITPNNWTNFQNLPQPKYYFQSVVLPDEGVLAICGYDATNNPTNTVYYLPPNADSNTPWV